MATKSDAPVDVAVKPAPLSGEQRQWLDAALTLIDAERMRTFNRAITAIHSPTGEERAISEWLTRHMQEMGLQTFYQPVDERSGNAVGRLPGRGGGPALMLYAPVDTHLRADLDEDVPWVGPELRPDMVPNAYIAANGDVIGLGAANPKGMVTALTEAVRCVHAAGVPLMGEVLLAFAGGGMPSMPPRHEARQNHGLSSGMTYMLNHGVTADCAIICKPGWVAAWEPGTEPDGFTNFDAFARSWSHHAYAKEDWWHRERPFKPDYIIMQWRMVVAWHARGIQTYGNWAPVEADD